MATQNERPFSMRLGLREYSISEEEFLHPGALVDSLLDEKLCETGGFIARLETWTADDGAKNVREVKTFINNEGFSKDFHPEWVIRQSLAHRALFDLNPIHEKTVEEPTDEAKAAKLKSLRRLKKRMKEAVNDCAFTPGDDSGELCQILKTDSVFHCSDAVLDNLENLGNDVVYLQNMTVYPPLETCAGVAMTEKMMTGLEKLSNQPLKGINTPTVYIGTEFSMFPAHREDMSFCAMNRHIAGAPKIWFCIPPAYYDAFLWMIRNLPIPDEQKSSVCQLLHKNLWPDPRMVIGCGIPVYPIVQRPGDIVFLLPNTIHWGFNTHFNMNEAVNFVCKTWILPGMISHQRCMCKEGWKCRYEIRDVLVSHGADPVDVKSWSAGYTLPIVQKLKKVQPKLYTHLKHVYEQVFDDELMAVGNAEGQLAPPSQSETVYAKCSRCDYCPKRCRSDAFERIAAHAKRCHGPDVAAEILQEVKQAYRKKGKTYKCKENTCPECGKVVRGNWSNVLDHQRRGNCKPVTEEDADDVAGPSSSRGAGENPRKRRKNMK